MEAPILHVCCRTLQDALALVKVAKPYAHRAVLLHVSPGSPSTEALRTEAERDLSRKHQHLLSKEPTPHFASPNSEAASCRQHEGLHPDASFSAVSSVDGRGAAASALSRPLSCAVQDPRDRSRGETAGEVTESVGVRCQPPVTGPKSRKRCSGQNEKKPGNERKKSSGRYVVELSGSVQLAVPLLLRTDCWMIPLPRAKDVGTHSLPEGGDGTGTQGLLHEAVPTGADGKHPSPVKGRGGEAMQRTDAAEKEHTGGPGLSDTLREDAETRKRWECLAELCNEALQGSRKKFMGLTAALDRLVETAVLSSSNESSRSSSFDVTGV